MLNEVKIIEVVAPTLTTENTLTMDLKTHGLSTGNIAAAKARLIAKRGSNGVAKAVDDKVAVSGDNLVITEGATGFATGDVFVMALVIGAMSSAAAVASTV